MISYGILEENESPWVQDCRWIRDMEVGAGRPATPNPQNRSQLAAPDAIPYSINFGAVTSQTLTHNPFLQAQGRILW